MSGSMQPLMSKPRFTLVTGMLRGAIVLGLCSASLASAQPTATQGIYTCTDAKGRKLTADRPIPDCADREQKVLNPSGTVKARVGPTLTARERAEQENSQKAEQEERARLNEERRRDRALMTRYPNKAVHDKERSDALAQIGVVRQAAVNRVDELMRQRAGIATEMEFYAKDPSKAPLSLRRQVDEVNHNLAAQDRFIADQDAELKRMNARFNEELARLRQLWAPAPRSPS